MKKKVFNIQFFVVFVWSLNYSESRAEYWMGTKCISCSSFQAQGLLDSCMIWQGIVDKHNPRLFTFTTNHKKENEIYPKNANTDNTTV